MNNIVFIDTETTGTNVGRDRIWQFAAQKMAIANLADGQTAQTLELVLNPVVEFTPEAWAMAEQQGITKKQLSEAPIFKEKAKEILAFLNGSIIAGFCISDFDIPLLWEEFYRCGIAWLLNTVPILDVGVIYKQKEARTLAAALKFYCNKTHDDAHNALADVVASRYVLAGQREHYPDLAAMTLPQIAAMSRPNDRVDLAGKLIYVNGVACFNIGDKQKGNPVVSDIKFANWMLEKDFPEQTKQCVRQILREADTKQKELL